MSRMTVVFVCTGNTCRSPLAMALARCRWPRGITFLSAGLQALDGPPATGPARAAAAERNAGLSEHPSRRLGGALVDAAGWIVGMTPSHVAQINARLGDAVAVRVGLLGQPGTDLRSRTTPDAEEVADPFGASLDTYRTAADQIDRLLSDWREIFSDAGDDQGDCS